MTTKTHIKPELRCSKCNGNFFYRDDDGRARCFLCGQALTKRDFGRLGGTTTYLRYGREHMRKLSLMRKRFAGRPRLTTLEELRQLTALESQSENKGDKLPTSLKGLKERYRLQQRSSQVIGGS